MLGAVGGGLQAAEGGGRGWGGAPLTAPRQVPGAESWARPKVRVTGRDKVLLCEARRALPGAAGGRRGVGRGHLSSGSACLHLGMGTEWGRWLHFSSAQHPPVLPG